MSGGDGGRWSGIDPFTSRGVTVEFEDGVITAVTDRSSDALGFIAPGLVDLQINGFMGHDFNSASPSAETVTAASSEIMRRGVTSFVPTVITADSDAMAARLGAIRDARRRSSLLSHAIPFAHVEGPWISPEDGPRGAHPRDAVHPPDLDEFDALQAACGGLIGMVTMSPHWGNAAEIIAELSRRGILVAIGHTGATPDQIHSAAVAGACLSTHLGNGAAANLPRHPNFLWAQLADDRLCATLIADDHHLPADTLVAMWRAKGEERVSLISDATALAGMAPGCYAQPIGGDVELSAEGRLSVAGTPYLAGAALPLGDMVVRAARVPGIGLASALRAATIVPGRFVGERGKLVPGASADLVRFDADFAAGRMTVLDVIVQGVPQ